MKNINKGPLFEFLLGRTSLLELLIIAIFISFGINVLTSSMILFAWFKPLLGFYLGSLICLISLLYLTIRVFRQQEKCRVFNGFFVLDKQSNNFVNVPRYALAESLTKILNSLFVENIALRVIWDKEPISSFFKVNQETNTVTKREPKSAKILKESFEYFILDKLSTHLCDYFNDYKFRKEALHEFKRNEIPDVLLSNRVLELFSKPMEDRPLFVNHIENNKILHENAVRCYGENGASYEKFDLVLPIGSKVKRITDDQIEIKTNRFTMTISVGLSGANTIVAPDFERYYLFIDKFGKAGIFEIYAQVKIKFNLRSFFSITGWEYYQWVDSFLQTLDQDISQKVFLENINWNMALTFIHCGNKCANPPKP